MDRPRRGRSDDNAAVVKETEEEKAPDDNNNNNMEVEATTPTPAPTPTPKQEIGDEQAPKIDEALSPNAAPASGPAHRDICFGEGSEEHRASLLLRDLIALHILLWKLSGKAMPTAEKDVEGLTERLFQLTKKGKGRDLAGLKDVPRPFLVKNGRFLVKEDGDWKELSDEEARAKLKSLIFTSFKAAETENEDEETENLKTLKKELREYLAAHEKDTESVVDHDSVKPTDVILLQRTEGEGDKAYDNQGGNKVMFMLASQYVNAESASPSKRLEAALSVFLSKGTTAQAQTAAASPPTPAAAATTIAGDGNGEGDKDKPAEEKPTEEKVEPRFIFCKSKGDGQRELSLVKPVDAAEVTLLFVFEVWLEKEIAGKTGASAASVAEAGASEMQPPGTEAIDTPTPHDVLFGRGGMTNSHQGNKRFRDVIALHRPDYIKAIKNDKPNVARKIVRAIRTSIPPGRFLRKHDDGKWYDVGDKVAAEKASQALREKSNAEKRERSAQREAQKGKGEGGSAGPKAKKAKTADTPLSPLLTNPLNYVGATIASTAAALQDKKENEDSSKGEGLPPNAVDPVTGDIIVTDYDILCGRGGLTNHHRGNKRFRDIVALHRPDYIRAPKVQKPSVARVIVRAIRNGDPPGRFLRKNEKTGKWYDVGDKKAAEKTSQALREKGHDKGEGVAGGTPAVPAGTSPAFLLPTPTVAPALGVPAVMQEETPAVKQEETPAPKQEESKEGDKAEEKEGEKKEEDGKEQEKSEEKQGEPEEKDEAQTAADEVKEQATTTVTV